MLDHKQQILGQHTLNKKFIGISTKLVINTNDPERYLGQEEKLYQLWQKFISVHYKEIKRHGLNDNVASIEELINDAVINKWASVEIATDSEYTDKNLNSIKIQGEYFGFIHIGTAKQFNRTFMLALDYLQNQNIKVDESRCRFEIMHKNYLPNDILAREEFWLPVV